MNQKLLFSFLFTILLAFSVIAPLTINRAEAYQDLRPLDSSLGLLGYWRFDEGTGTTSEDLSGFGRAAELLSGATWAMGQYSYGLGLDGTNDYASIQDVSTLSNVQGSISVWVNHAQTQAGGRGILSFTLRPLIYLSGDALTVYFQGSTGMNITDYSGSYAFSLSALHHIVFCWSGDTYWLYLDGELLETVGGCVFGATDVGDEELGRYGASNYFNGTIDELAIFDNALASQEVADLFNGVYAPSANGASTISISGNGGKIGGGDTFEIYAGGSDYVPADVLATSFDTSERPNNWYYWVSGSDTIEEQTQFHLSTTQYALEIKNTPDHVYYPYIEYWFPSAFTSETVYWQTYAMYRNDTDSEFAMSAVNDAEISQWKIFFNGSDSNIYLIEGLFDETILRAYEVGVFYNITVEYVASTGALQIWIDGADEGAYDCGALGDRNWKSIFYYINDKDNPALYYGYLNNVKVWKTWTGGTGGTVSSTQYWTKVQSLHTQFSLVLPYGTAMINDWGSKGFADSELTSIGFQYYYNGEWVEGLRADISIIDGKYDGTNDWVLLKVSWNSLDAEVKSDYLYAQWEDNTNKIRLYTDLWFNQGNDSRIIGGRINAYFYGVADSSAWWARWFTGASWGAMIDQVSFSMAFIPLTDADGNVISSKDLPLTRITFKQTVTNTYAYYVQLKNFETTDFQFASGEMRGVQTIQGIDPIMPNMAQGGLVPSIIAGFSTLSFVLAEFFDKLKIQIGTVGTVLINSWFSLAGWSNGFSVLYTWITSFSAWMVSAITYSITLLTSFFLLLSTWVPSTLQLFAGMVVGSFGMFSIFAEIYNSVAVTFNGGIAFTVSILAVIPLIIFIWIMSSRSFTEMLDKIRMLGSITKSSIEVLLKIGSFGFDLIMRIIQVLRG